MAPRRTRLRLHALPRPRRRRRRGGRLPPDGLVAPPRRRRPPPTRRASPTCPTRRPGPRSRLSDDGRWLLVHVERGWSQTDVHLLDRDAGRVDHRHRGRRGHHLAPASTATATASSADHPRRAEGPPRSLPLDGPPGPRRWPRATAGVDPSSGSTELVPEGDDVLTGLRHHRRPPARAAHAGRRVVAPPPRPRRHAPRATSAPLLGGLAAVTGLAAHPSAPGLVAVGHTSFTRPDTVTAWRPAPSGRRAHAAPRPGLGDAAVTPGALRVDRRHRRADAPRPRRHDRRRRRHADAPHRLRRLQHHRDAGVEPVRRHVVRARRPGGHPRPPRRRRGGRGVAPGRHAGPTSRRCSPTSRRPPTGSSPRAAPRAAASRSAAAPTAGCWSPPAWSAGPTSARRSCATSR